MNGDNKRFCNINFVDGESMRFTYEPAHPDEYRSMSLAIEEMAQTNKLIFTIEDKLVIVPINNVRSIEISPSPTNLPMTVIKAQSLD
jgi:hypothetical protein